MKSFKYFLLIVLFFVNTNLFANNTSINIDKLLTNKDFINKHVIVFFHMNHCPYCTRMEHSTFKNKNIQKMIKKYFVFIDINTDENTNVIFNKKKYNTKEFTDHLEINFFPTTIFIDNKKDIVYTARGLRKVNKFTKILQFIQTKSYEDIDFFEYKPSLKK